MATAQKAVVFYCFQGLVTAARLQNRAWQVKTRCVRLAALRQVSRRGRVSVACPITGVKAAAMSIALVAGVIVGFFMGVVVPIGGKGLKGGSAAGKGQTDEQGSRSSDGVGGLPQPEATGNPLAGGKVGSGGLPQPDSADPVPQSGEIVIECQRAASESKAGPGHS